MRPAAPVGRWRNRRRSDPVPPRRGLPFAPACDRAWTDHGEGTRGSPRLCRHRIAAPRHEVNRELVAGLIARWRTRSVRRCIRCSPGGRRRGGRLAADPPRRPAGRRSRDRQRDLPPAAGRGLATSPRVTEHARRVDRQAPDPRDGTAGACDPAHRAAPRRAPLTIARGSARLSTFRWESCKTADASSARCRIRRHSRGVHNTGV